MGEGWRRGARIDPSNVQKCSRGQKGKRKKIKAEWHAPTPTPKRRSQSNPILGGEKEKMPVC